MKCKPSKKSKIKVYKKNICLLIYIYIYVNIWRYKLRNDIYENILEVRNGNDNSLMEIIEIFNPLISKYSRKLDGEDTKQDLIIFLIKILNKIPIDNKAFCNNKVIFTYIAKAIYHEYIKLSKIKDKKVLNETELELDIEIGYEEFESEVELLDMFKVLSEKEAYVIKLIYVYSLSVSEVAQYMKISRQAVNKTKNRALSKIRKLYLT